MALLAACGDEPVVAPPAALVSASESSASLSTATTRDRDILIALYNATDGPSWVNNENWLTDAPTGEWYGVDTDASGRVVRLDLAGELDQENQEWVTHGLAGSIPPELGGLANLESLSLGRNDLTGSIPPELGGLANLKTLSLRWNDLTGSIPPELGGLANLARLWLHSNNLTGSIPSSFLQLDGLREFFFPGNAGLCAPGTTGFVEWLSRVERHEGPLCNAADKAVLVSLHELAGGANWTNPEGWLGGGALEEWHGVGVDSLGRVTALDLTHNGLSGQLSWTMGELAQLTELRIADNADLSGRLPLSLAGLSLQTLHYSGTDLCAPADEAYRVWLAGIPSHEGTGEECALFPDRETLEILYETTGGPNWNESGNWLTHAPLGVWHGVQTDADGRVTSLDLRGNGLEGPIPAELGRLAELDTLILTLNRLTGSIPPELGALAKAKLVDLARNELSGPIPAELGGLASVEELGLDGNKLTSVPPELGELGNLQELDLDENRLTSIPGGLARLERLEILWVASNALTSIPPDLGALNSLRLLVLEGNRLTDIAIEPGGYPNLRFLDLSSNEFTSFPRELGELANLRQLELDRNRLTDVPPGLGGMAGAERVSSLSSYNGQSAPVPGRWSELDYPWQLDPDGDQSTPVSRKLRTLGTLRAHLGLDGNQSTKVRSRVGGLAGLEILDVSSNELSGPLPAGLVELTGLTSLGLADNVGLTGALPLDLTALESLEDLHTTGTELCAPADPAFLDWLAGVTRQRVALCERDGDAAAYLTQAVQSREFPVPLVAGEPALLRVFVTAEQATDATMPPVRATFYRDGAVTYELDIPSKQDSIPAAIDESSLSKSVNAEIPGWVIQPGLEVVIEPDPAGTLDPALDVARRIPATGRMAVDVWAMPVFEVTLVPFIWEENPDSSIVEITAAMAADRGIPGAGNERR